jgi:hypothetical protein
VAGKKWCVDKQPTPVGASFAATWEATVDLFAEQNIQIKTIDRSSGILVAERASIGATTQKLADCGTDMGIDLRPTSVTYNVLVRGDSSAATLRVNARWVRVGMGRGLRTDTVSEECGSTGLWETDFERDVKTRAEAKAKK